MGDALVSVSLILITYAFTLISDSLGVKVNLNLLKVVNANESPKST